MNQPRPLVPTSSHLVPDEEPTNLVPSSPPLQGDEGRDEVAKTTHHTPTSSRDEPRRRRNRKPHPSQLMWQNARTLYETGGHSIRELARKLGVAPSTVLRRIDTEHWTKGPDPTPAVTEPPNGDHNQPPDTPSHTSHTNSATPPNKDAASAGPDDRRLAVIDPMAGATLESLLERLPERARADVEAQIRARMVSRAVTAGERAAERAERCEQEARDLAERLAAPAWSSLRFPEYF